MSTVNPIPNETILNATIHNATILGDIGGKDNNTVEWVALVFSIIALIATLFQLFREYSASAVGWTCCSQRVIGRWSEFRNWKMRWLQFRIEVRFETPVLFVCPPTNKRGPIKDQEPVIVTGEKRSLDETRSELPRSEEQEAAAQKLSLKDRGIHTADNERASWLELLSHLHLMEKESKEWQAQQKEYAEKRLARLGPPADNPDSLGSPEDNPDHPMSLLRRNIESVDFKKHHTLAVAVQRKKRSWDDMPSSVKKPYATTTICHILEIAAMMGIHWKEFDRCHDRYRAEGNGFMLTGTHIPDLGLMFTLHISGQSKFRENRVIPVDEVKELCCGFVSTIFQTNKDFRRVTSPAEDPKDLGLLKLGSMNEIAETMVLLDCTTDTAKIFLNKDANHMHLFAVPFELVGMLGKTLYIRNSGFRMLPNPTPYHWDRNFFDLRQVIKEFSRRLEDPERPDFRGLSDEGEQYENEKANKSLSAQQLEKLLQWSKQLSGLFKKERELNKKLQEAKAKLKGERIMNQNGNQNNGEQQSEQQSEQRAFAGRLGRATGHVRGFANSVLRNRFARNHHQGEGVEMQPQNCPHDAPLPEEIEASGHSFLLYNALYDVLKECDNFILSSDRDLVRLIIREHFQQILKMINERGASPDAISSTAGTGTAPSSHEPPTRGISRHRTTDSSGPSDHGTDGYVRAERFDQLTTEPPERRAKIFMDVYFYKVLSVVCERAVYSFESYRRRLSTISPRSNMPRTVPLSRDISSMSGGTLTSEPPAPAATVGRPDIGSLEAQATAIWCTLVLRMLCWLQLHDFDKRDVQISKSELLGSRLPVYIA